MCRAPDLGAIGPFADALYTAQLRLLLAARMPIAGVAQDLPSMLADLRQHQPSSTAPASKQLMDSITYSAHLHSTIAWLASELSSPEAQEQLQHALLHSDAAVRLQQQLHGIFAELTHQRLFVSYLLQYCDGNVSEVLDGAACRVGLGDWTEPWANAMRYTACSFLAFSCDMLCKYCLDAPSRLSHASSLSHTNSCSCQVVTSRSPSLANAMMTNMLDKVVIYVSQQAQEATPVHRP